jgi:drug/metabolite transporter (DMT)-like permease
MTTTMDAMPRLAARQYGWVAVFAATPRVALLCLSALLFGLNSTFTKYALRGFGPFVLLSVELGVAVILAWTVLLARSPPRGPARDLRPRRSWVLLGVLEPGLANAGLNMGLVYTTASAAALLSGLEGCLTVLLAVMLLRRRITFRGLLAVMAAGTGAVLVSAHGSLRADAGNLLVTAGVLAAALYTIEASRQRADTDSVLMTTWQLTSALAVIVPVAAWRCGIGAEAIPTHVSWHEWAGAVAAGGISIGGAFLLFNCAVTRASAAASGMMINLIPLVGLAAATVLLGESVTFMQLVGGLLIVGGVSSYPAADALPASSEAATRHAQPGRHRRPRARPSPLSPVVIRPRRPAPPVAGPPIPKQRSRTHLRRTMDSART